MEDRIYYIHINGEQRGPFERSRLIDEGLTLNTMVWHPGLSDWVQAETLPELVALIRENEQMQIPEYQEPEPQPYQPEQPQPYQPQQPQQYQQPGYQQPQPYQPQQPQQYQQSGYQQQQNYSCPPPVSHVPGTLPPGWTNWMVWAIVGTVLGTLSCSLLLGMIFGIVGIVKANSANDAARMGDPAAASLNSSAKTWTLLSLIFSGVWILLILLYLIFCFVFGLASSAVAFDGYY